MESTSQQQTTALPLLRKTVLLPFIIVAFIFSAVTLALCIASVAKSYEYQSRQAGPDNRVDLWDVTEGFAMAGTSLWLIFTVIGMITTLVRDTRGFSRFFYVLASVIGILAWITLITSTCLMLTELITDMKPNAGLWIAFTIFLLLGVIIQSATTVPLLMYLKRKTDVPKYHRHVLQTA